MRLFAKASLRKKLTLITLLTSSMALLLATIAFVSIEVWNFRKNILAETSGLADIVSQNLAPSIVFRDQKSAQQVLSSLRSDDRIHQAVVYTDLKDNNYFVTYKLQPEFELITTEHIVNKLLADNLQCKNWSFDFSHFDLCKTVWLDSEPVAVLVIRMGLESFYIQLGFVIALVVMFALASLLLASLLLKKLSPMILTPIQQLTVLAKNVSENKDYSMRAENVSFDEIGILTDGFNAMLEEIGKQQGLLKRHSDELEVAVKERTMELTNALEQFKSAKEIAEKANLAKSDFLSQMSHELRTPLNAILGFGQLLDNALAGEKEKEYMGFILSAGDHLLRLINEVLDLARIEAGKLEMSVEDVNLTGLLNECIALLQTNARQHNVTISSRIDENEAWIVKADHIRLKQVILNLLNNAVKYNKRDGTVEISSKIIRTDCIRLYVKDTGNGLTEEQMKMLFVPFERAGAEKSSILGTGIGLTISRHLMEMMDGDIGVESSYGEGSLFWIELILSESSLIDLPIAKDEKEDVLVLDSNAECKKTILYIEDNKMNLDLVDSIVNDFTSHRFVGVEVPEAGLESARRLQPELILLDVNLPGMNGYEVLEQLKLDPVTASIPVIAISANAMSFDLDKGREAGFTDYITKPIDVKQLLARIEEELS